MVRKELLRKPLNIALISAMMLAGCGNTQTDSPADDRTQAEASVTENMENTGSTTDSAITEEKLSGHPETSENLFFTQEEDDGTITIRGYDGEDPVVVIPETIGGKTVACINFQAFDGEDILAVRIPKTVKEIENEAFMRCEKLECVVIEGSLSEIGTNAFAGDTSLHSVLINSVEVIGQQAFMECSALKEISLPEGLETVGWNAFEGTGITEITLPVSLKEVKKDAMPEGLTECSILSKSIKFARADFSDDKSYAFSRCRDLTVYYPKGIDSLELEAIQRGAEECGNQLTLIEQ